MKIPPTPVKPVWSQVKRVPQGMERGFDAVRVAEIAEACGVSEKTAFNYFPIKESLILDRLES